MPLSISHPLSCITSIHPHTAQEPIANAFVFPGGYIIVYTGLLQLLRKDPDLLAMVMGHEIAHALARHNTGAVWVGACVSKLCECVCCCQWGSLSFKG